MNTKSKYNEGISSGIVGEILFRLYGIDSRIFRNFIRWLVLRLEKGTVFSVTIRRIFSKYHQVSVGMYSAMGCFKFNHFRPGTTIGRYCAIYNTAQAFAVDHPMNTKSIHSIFYNPTHGYVDTYNLKHTRLTIGNDVFIGHNAILLPSVSHIGDGAIIGAGAVVNKDIPPYAVVVGNPGRIVRYRFSEKTIQELEKSKWWEKSADELLPEFDTFQHPLEQDDQIL